MPDVETLNDSTRKLFGPYQLKELGSKRKREGLKQSLEGSSIHGPMNEIGKCKRYFIPSPSANGKSVKLALFLADIDASLNSSIIKTAYCLILLFNKWRSR